MKKLLLATLLTITASSAFAATGIDVCNAEEKANGTIMEMRQMGVEMSKIMKVLKTQAEIDRVIDAYEVPMYNSKKYQQKKVVEFKNKHYLICVKALK